jgi:hypothetical protein
MPYHNLGSCLRLLLETGLNRHHATTYVRLGQVVESLLVRRISLLKIVHHEVAVTCARLMSVHITTGCSGVLPRLPQASPFAGSTLRMFFRYSMASGYFSFVLRMQEMALSVPVDH